MLVREINKYLIQDDCVVTNADVKLFETTLLNPGQVTFTLFDFVGSIIDGYTVTVDLKADVVSDAQFLSLGNLASQFSFTYDNQVPDVTEIILTPSVSAFFNFEPALSPARR